MRIWPPVAISSPAIRRKVDVFPHPDGPSSVTSWPGSMVNDTASTAVTCPYALVTDRKTTEDAAFRLGALLGVGDKGWSTCFMRMRLGRQGERCPVRPPGGQAA